MTFCGETSEEETPFPKFQLYVFPEAVLDVFVGITSAGIWHKLPPISKEAFGKSNTSIKVV